MSLFATVRLYGNRFECGEIVATASDVATGERRYAMALQADVLYGPGDGHDYSDLNVRWVDASALVTMPVAVAA